MVWQDPGSPSLTSILVGAIRAHPRRLGDEDLVSDSGQYGGGKFGKSAALIGRANGVVVLQLRRFELSQHIQPAVNFGGWKYVSIRRQKIRVAGKLVVIVNRGLGVGFRGGLVIHGDDPAGLVLQNQVEHAKQFQVRWLSLVGVKPGG